MKRQIQYMRAQLNKAEELLDENKTQEYIQHIQEVKKLIQEILEVENYINNNKVNREDYLEFINKRPWTTMKKVQKN